MPEAPGFTESAESYWERVYGITSRDEFEERIGQGAYEYLAWFGPSYWLAVENGYHLRGPAFALASAWAARNLSVDPPSVGGQSIVDAVQGALSPVIGVPLMSQLIVPNCFQVAIHAVSGGQEVVNVIGVQNGAGTALGAATAVQTAWKVALGPLASLSSLYALTEFRSMDLSSSNGAIASIADTATGGAAGAALSTNAACALVKWNGGTRSKSSRGRLYFGPLAESQINTDGRTVASASRTQFQTAFNNFRSSLSTSGYPLVVLSRKLSQSFTVTSSDVETVIATQRRRIRS